MWIRYERLRNHNKAKHNKTVCIFLVIYCIYIALFQEEHISSFRLSVRYGCWLQHVFKCNFTPIHFNFESYLLICQSFVIRPWQLWKAQLGLLPVQSISIVIQVVIIVHGTQIVVIERVSIQCHIWFPVLAAYGPIYQHEITSIPA